MKSEETPQDSDANMEGPAFMGKMDLALERMNERPWWVLSVFLLASSPGMFNAYHIMVSTFYAPAVPHWCRVLELQEASWTEDQIKAVSTTEPDEESICTMSAWNYTYLAQLGYEKSLEFAKSNPVPSKIPCEQFVFKEKEHQSTTVSEWNLVCDRKVDKSNVQGSIAIGKFVGGFIFGFLADRYGRKFAFVLACLTYIIFGPLAALAPSFWSFVMLRFLIGVAGSGCYETGFTILAELMSKDHRAMLGCIYNLSYPVGYMTLPLIALAFPKWRNLQLAISLPTLLLLVNCWFIPESPKWLLTKGHAERAWNIIGRVDKSLVPTLDNDDEQVSVLPDEINLSVFSKIIGRSQKMCLLFSTVELCTRIAIMYIAWFSAALSYYILALNADNFETSHHVYTFLTGLVEIPGYTIPLLIMLWLGRKCTTFVLFFISGLALVSIAGIPREQTVLLLTVALLGRFTDVAVFGVVVIYTSELFPTTVRNTAVGSCLAISQLGSIYAPYIVDLLSSSYGWYVPSTLCGCMALLAAVMALLLPETRGRPLLDTLEQLKRHPDRVSCYKCCLFS